MATAQLTPARVGIQHVLIATDFSRYSDSALHFGLQLAKAYGASSYIVYVVPSEPYLLAGPEVYVSARDAARRDLEQLQSELLRTHCLREGDDYHLYLLEGEIGEAILNFARDKRIDLIVMGTHGRGGLGKALLGSVAENVFRHSPVPVLTLGPGVCRSDWKGQPREILVPADFTPASRRAVQYALEMADEHQAHVTLLHVVAPRELQHVPDHAAVQRGIEMRLAELANSGTGSVSCATRIEVGKVTETILQVASEMAADLLVVGVRPSSGVLDRLVIPHAYEIVRDSPCPVLTLRETKATPH